MKNRSRQGAAGLLAAALMTTAAVAAPVTFPDIGNHWAAPFIARMAERGVVSGMEDGRYAPDDKVTGAQFAVMVTKEFYPEDIQGKGEQWYVPFMLAASENQLLKGVTGAPDSPLTRYEMASVMYQVMVNAGKAQVVEDTSAIGDWAQVPADYQAAVAGCYQAGLLSGVNEKGDFAGRETMDRAQAAVVMDKLIQTLKGEGQKPAEKPKPDAALPEGSKEINGGNSTLLNGQYRDGKFYLKNSGTGGAGAAIKLETGGAKHLRFTVTVHALPEADSQLVCVVEDAGRNSDVLFQQEQKSGTTVDYDVEISGNRIFLDVSSGTRSDAVISGLCLY